MRVDEIVEQGVDAIALVAGDGAHGLLAHGALVRVARTLIVVRVGDQSGAHAQQRERLDLQMGRLLADAVLVDGDETVVLFVDVQVFDQTVVQEVFEGAVAVGQLRHVLLTHLRLPLGHDDVRSESQMQHYCIRIGYLLLVVFFFCRFLYKFGVFMSHFCFFFSQNFRKSIFLLNFGLLRSNESNFGC